MGANKMGERIRQIKTYLSKFFRLFFKTAGWKVFIFGAVISVIVAYVVGDDMFVLGQATESGCFTLVSACIWIGIFNSIQVVCKERDIIKREHRTGLHISAYIIARALYELVICIIQALILTFICMLFFEFPDEGLVTGLAVVDIALTFFLALLSADYLGIAVSSIVKTTTTAMTVMPFILILQLVFSGVLFTLEEPVSTMAGITISKWGMEALGAISNINGIPYSSMGGMISNDAYLYEVGHVIDTWLMLLLFIVIYITIAIISLEFVDKDKR